MGVANGSAVALAGNAPLRIFNAGGSEPLRLRAVATDLDARPAISPDAEFASVLPARTAQPVSLRPGTRKIEIKKDARRIPTG